MGSTTEEQRISVRVNGEPRSIPAFGTIVDMLRAIGIDPARVAVERNREVVSRSTLGEVAVGEGDQFEIVHFVGGG